MAAATYDDEFVETTTAAALEEKAKLKKHFGRFDMLFFLICTLVGLDTLGSVAAQGAQGFTWLAFLALVFFVPYALLTAELGSTFTEEGGSYIWVKLAFGRFTAAIQSVLYWLSNPIWLGGTLTITAATTFGTFFTPLNGAWKYVFALLFIWFAVWAAILSFSIGKWIPTIGAIVRVVVLAFFSLSVIVYAASNGVHGVSAGDFSPTWTVFIAAVPVLFFNYVGFELPNAAGDEMKDPRRDVPFTVLRSAVGAVLLYGVPILAILLVLPASRITSLGGFIDAMKTVFTVYGGHVTKDGAVLTGAGKILGDLAAIGFILALLSSGTTWIMGADRSQAVAGFDGAAPRSFGYFSARWGTPVVVNLLSGVFSTIVMVLAYQLTTGDANKYFTAVLGLAISTTTISYLVVFPAVIKLRYSHPHVPRPYRVPGGTAGVWLAGVLCTLWSALATVALLYPGFGTSNPDDSLPDGWAGQRGSYELSQFLPLAVLIVIGLAFYVAGAKTRSQIAQVKLADPSLTAEGAPLAP
ncbi:APC family permease [Candidatus Solirubrobacter pratensis]|uniref:APC family permease n=1 Tax=Candidatus Solirubrobacter pratensis TaxID=1298857 RepID=UPI00041273C2|nr:APC family permease [Candidatus Solirubrobacter pratensis]